MTWARRQSARRAVGLRFQTPVQAPIGPGIFGAGKFGRRDEK